MASPSCYANAKKYIDQKIPYFDPSCGSFSFSSAHPPATFTSACRLQNMHQNNNLPIGMQLSRPDYICGGNGCFACERAALQTNPENSNWKRRVQKSLVALKLSREHNPINSNFCGNFTLETLQQLQPSESEKSKPLYVFDEKLGRKRRHDPWFAKHKIEFATCVDNPAGSNTESIPQKGKDKSPKFRKSNKRSYEDSLANIKKDPSTCNARSCNNTINNNNNIGVNSNTISTCSAVNSVPSNNTYVFTNSNSNNDNHNNSASMDSYSETNTTCNTSYDLEKDLLFTNNANNNHSNFNFNSDLCTNVMSLTCYNKNNNNNLSELPNMNTNVNINIEEVQQLLFNGMNGNNMNLHGFDDYDWAMGVLSENC